MKNSESRIMAIARAIAAHLERGITPGPEVMEFAETVLGVYDSSEAARLIGDDDGYGQGLAEMVFFPGRDIRFILEPLLPAEGLSSDDVSVLAEEVMARVPRVTVSFSPDTPATIAFTPVLAGKYISRLNLTGKIPPELSRTPNSAEEAARYMEVRIRLRSTSGKILPFRYDHITELVRNIADPRSCSTDDFTGALDLLIRVMEQNPEERDIFMLLAHEKKTWANLLQQTRSFDELMKSRSMDYLMSMRISPPPINPDQALTDLVSLALFGRTAPSPAPEDCRVLDMKKIDADAMEKLLRGG